MGKLERIDRQKEVLITILKENRAFKAGEFNVSNQNEVLIFLEEKQLITRDWNDKKKKDFKWNYIADSQKKRAREFLGLDYILNASQKSKH